MIIIDRHGKQRREPDPHYVLQDGEQLLVRMYAMDSLQREVAKAWPPTVTASDAGGVERDAYVTRLAEAYRSPNNVISKGPLVAAPKLTGDAVTDAYLERSHWYANAWRNPAPLAEVNKSSDAIHSKSPVNRKIVDARERAHNDYSARLQNAWRAA